MSEISVTPKAPIVGSSEALQVALDRAFSLARGCAPVLIVAEKGLEATELAMYIHEHSRRKGAFHRVYAPELAEPEAFIETPPGVYSTTYVHVVLQEAIQRAQGGTLFVEEIAELPYFGQGRLENLLHQQVRGVPGADVRLIASSAFDLYVPARDGDFREDLLARLLTSTVYLPPLRERQGDAHEIAAHVLKTHPYLAERVGTWLDVDAMQLLGDLQWPGNRTQLESVLVRAALAADNGAIRPEHIDAALQAMETAFDPLWSGDDREPGAGLTRQLDPEPVYVLPAEQQRREAAELALATRVVGEEQVRAFESEGKLPELVLLVAIAQRRLLERAAQDGIVREKDLRQITLLRGPHALKLVEVLVEDGVLIEAPVTGRKRAWSRVPEA